MIVERAFETVGLFVGSHRTLISFGCDQQVDDADHRSSRRQTKSRSTTLVYHFQHANKHVAIYCTYFLVNVPGASKGTHDDAKCITEIFGGTKIRKSEGAKFKMC